MRLAEIVVDALPKRLWRPGNLYMLPGGSWHFCVGHHPTLPHSVRTIEREGKELAHGRRHVSLAEHA